MTSKHGTETAAAMQAILDKMEDKPLLDVQSDKGTELHAAAF